MTNDAALPSGVASELGTTLAVWAHPDDETYLAGGLLPLLREAGQRVVCVTATRGEAADPRATPAERSALAATRTAELLEAAGVLGIDEHHWLDLPDGGCHLVDPHGPARRIAAIAHEIDVDTIVTFGPDGFTGHPDHRAVSAWVDQAVALGADPVRVLHAAMTYADREAGRELDEQFGVYALGEPRLCRPDEVALLVELSGAALNRKVEALVRQRSQTAGIIEALGLPRFAEWVSREVFVAPA